MKLPIIICEGRDINIFSSLEDACSYIEPIDVKKGEYTAYDSDGYLLNITIIEKQRTYFCFWKFNTLSVNIEEAKGENRSEELIEKLIAFLSAAGEKEFDKNARLPELVSYTEVFLSRKIRAKRNNGD
ncbi:hypothetical protein [Methylocaldum sp. RMAD-M]|jgi:hypothetical protein|uniref:hypothetical protein n=1 Tax=Methylocaldum sp. RMAD-M TaxID=2806557 RepID=UPI001AE2E8BD|nr:hypothetical protein [Methylocaldum sp. RMAD-M]MBP1152570.1 hypothetical protein [Methylocaldum sp. RMAD-M]